MCKDTLCWTSATCRFVLGSRWYPVSYVLHTYLPERPQIVYFLRTKLITSLAKLVTIVRCLYKYCYWLLFPQCGSYIYVCLHIYIFVLYAVVITCVCQCDSIKKLDDDDVGACVCVTATSFSIASLIDGHAHIFVGVITARPHCLQYRAL